MKTIIVVPVSLGSSRLPGKALLAETGRPLFLHVIERAQRSRRGDRVLVATDDHRVAAIARARGIEVRMTSAGARTGTDRVAEATAHDGAHIVVNLQGDEPLMVPEDVDRVIEACAAERADVVTLAQEIREESELVDPNAVKVVMATDGRALYFSRAGVPFRRDPAAFPIGKGAALYHHRGIYAFREAAIRRFAALPTSRLEAMEKLEQLRALEAGFAIHVVMTENHGFGINGPDDYRHFVDLWRTSSVGAEGG